MALLDQEVIRFAESLDDYVHGSIADIGGWGSDGLNDPARKEALMKVIRLVEEDPYMLGSSHLLAVGSKPAG